MAHTARVAAAAITAAPDPLYRQVYDAIGDAISSGQLSIGDRLPPERSFCEQFGVSRATVRRALGRFVEEGVLEAAVGRGHFVRRGILQEPLNALLSFTELAVARGLEPSALVISQTVRPATPEEAGVFDITVDDLVFTLERLRLLDLAPTALHRTRIPASLVAGIDSLDFTTASIYAALDSAGFPPATANVVISATTADELGAERLEVATGAPLIVCTTMSRDRRGRLVEIGEITYRADRFQFRATLMRPNHAMGA
jgi:GntR family transcriptional regulator